MDDFKQIIVIVDMDDTICNFIGDKRLPYIGYKPLHVNYEEMYLKGFFLKLKPIKGALEGVRKLLEMKHLDVHIGSMPLKDSHHCYSEKVRWVQKHLPELSHKIILTQNKEMIKGDYLIDDSMAWKEKWESSDNRVFVHFDPRKPTVEQWDNIVDFFRKMV